MLCSSRTRRAKLQRFKIRNTGVEPSTNTQIGSILRVNVLLERMTRTSIEGTAKTSYRLHLMGAITLFDDPCNPWIFPVKS